ncbi:hypothetical protein, partial [Vibrio metschnikovii]|uniref:hypothetical protein n=1 Tax=Vibrio metschnikovii TaxID=28172 RepID=UPI0035579EB8
AFWLRNNEERLARSCNHTCSKSIQVRLRFGEIMRGSLSAWHFYYALVFVITVLCGKLVVALAAP